MSNSYEIGNGYTIEKYIAFGSYGQCYMVKKNNAKFACKTFENLSSYETEVNILAKLQHPNIVKFVENFDDVIFGHIVMELCVNGTLQELLIKRSFLNNAEVRYLSKQIVYGLQYLHSLLIIHRDLKLNNILLTADMTVKIIDFGLSVQLEHKYEIRDTLCGTKTYLAPETITNTGHSMEIDIWALGCVIFTLLDGKEPFGNGDSEETLENICKVSCKKSTRLTKLASSLLKSIFVCDPSKRPTADTILSDKYFKTGFTPDYLTTDVFLKNTKKIDVPQKTERKTPFKDRTNIEGSKIICKPKNEFQITGIGKENKCTTVRYEHKMKLRSQKLTPERNKRTILQPAKKEKAKSDSPMYSDSTIDDFELPQNTLTMLVANLYQVLKFKSSCNATTKNRSFVCVSRWVKVAPNDLGYNLNDGSFGLKLSDGHHIHSKIGGCFTYLAADTSPIYFNKDNIPTPLETLMNRAKDTRQKLLQLVRSGPVGTPNHQLTVVTEFQFFQQSDCWGVIFLLSNGSFQVNFSTHEKIVIHPDRDLLAVFNEEETWITSMEEAGRYGMPDEAQCLLMDICSLFSKQFLY